MNVRTDRSGIRAALATAAVAAVVLAGASACVGSSTPGASAGTGAGSSSASSAGTVSLPAASSSATSAAGAGGGTTAAAGAGSSAASAHNNSAACANADIAVSLGHAGAAMNHDGQVVVFKNVSSRTCTLQGYPGAAVVSGSATLVNASRQLNGYIGDMRQLSSAPLVTLQPGQSASAEVEWEGNAGEQCYPNGSGKLVVTPPNTTKSTQLSAVTVGTQGMCAGFQVHPVVAGIISG